MGSTAPNPLALLHWRFKTCIPSRRGSVSSCGSVGCSLHSRAGASAQSCTPRNPLPVTTRSHPAFCAPGIVFDLFIYLFFRWCCSGLRDAECCRLPHPRVRGEVGGCSVPSLAVPQAVLWPRSSLHPPAAPCPSLSAGLGKSH